MSTYFEDWTDDLGDPEDDPPPGAATSDEDADLRLASLIEQANAGGLQGQLATELLAIRVEREQKAKAAALAKVGEEIAATEGVDFGRPEVQEVILAYEAQRADAAAKASAAGQRSFLVSQGFEGATLEREMAVVAERQAAVAAWEAREGFLDHNDAYQAQRSEQAQERAAHRVALEAMTSRSMAEELAEPGNWLDEVRSGVQDTYLEVLNGVG